MARDLSRAILLRISDMGDCDIRLHRLSLAKLFDQLGDARAADAVTCQDVNFFEVPARALEVMVGAASRLAELNALINSPEIGDFMRGVPIEAAHQVQRWGSNHDAGKSPLDWVWLLGHLINKAAAAAIAGDAEKALHHTISSAGALANWHRALAGGNNRMRPGVDAVACGFETPTSAADANEVRL